MYRRDGWDAPLSAALRQLATCVQRLKQPREHVALSLELAALLRGTAPEEASKLAAAGVASLVTGALGALIIVASVLCIVFGSCCGRQHPGRRASWRAGAWRRW